MGLFSSCVIYIGCKIYNKIGVIKVENCLVHRYFVYVSLVRIHERKFLYFLNRNTFLYIQPSSFLHNCFFFLYSIVIRSNSIIIDFFNAGVTFVYNGVSVLHRLCPMRYIKNMI